MSAQRLRDAAEVLRRRGERATPGAWTVAGGGEYLQGPGILVGDGVGSISTTDADLIATMSPPFALALADVLDSLAFDRGVNAEIDGRTWRELQTLADLILGAQS